MAGKHRASSGRGASNLIAAALAVVLVGGAGYAGYRMLNGDPGEAAATSPASPAPTSSAAPEQTSAPDSGSTSPSEAPSTPDAASTSSPAPATSSATSTTGADRSAALPAGCRSQLAAGATAVTAADRSYRDWHAHTQADLDYRSGKNSWAKTQKIWAETKAKGDGDVAGFRKARQAYAKTANGGCSSVKREQASPTVVRCLDRFKALDAAVGAGGKVNDDWARHVQMMKHKDHSDPKVYQQQWRKMVGDAGPNQGAYRTAKKAYDQAPACSA